MIGLIVRPIGTTYKTGEEKTDANATCVSATAMLLLWPFVFRSGYASSACLLAATDSVGCVPALRVKPMSVPAKCQGKA